MADAATAPAGSAGSTETTPTGTTATAAATTEGQATATPGTGTSTTANAPATGTEETFFDPKSIEGKPELEAAYKQMRNAFTKRMQDLARDRGKIEAYDAFQADPVSSMQRFAKQFGYNLTRAEAAAAVATEQATGQQFNPQTWEEVRGWIKDSIIPEIQQHFAPLVKNVQKVTASNIERELDSVDPQWRVYEDSMKENIKLHPTLVNDVSMLYRMSVPPEVLEGRAVQTALRKLEDKTRSAQVHGSQNTSRSTPAPKQVKSFQDAVEAAKAGLAASGR